jgi:hypothetical protein
MPLLRSLVRNKQMGSRKRNTTAEPEQPIRFSLNIIPTTATVFL